MHFCSNPTVKSPYQSDSQTAILIGSQSVRSSRFTSSLCHRGAPVQTPMRRGTWLSRLPSSIHRFTYTGPKSKPTFSKLCSCCSICSKKRVFLRKKANFLLTLSKRRNSTKKSRRSRWTPLTSITSCLTWTRGRATQICLLLARRRCSIRRPRLQTSTLTRESKPGSFPSWSKKLGLVSRTKGKTGGTPRPRRSRSPSSKSPN